MTESKPRVVVFGGCGFIGREIVHTLISEDVAEVVVVADKVPPQMAWLSPRHQTAFNHDAVKFRSANLINAASVEAVFAQPFDWAINAAGETKLGLSETVYEEGITKLSLNCARAAAKHGVRVFLEISDGRMSSSEKQNHSEGESCKAWSVVSGCKAKVEKQLMAELQQLPWLVLRPAMVYGPGDRQGLASMLVVGAVYRQLQETMKLLWDAGLRINTVHVTDLARAVVFLCQKGKCREVYNVVDSGNSTQGSLASIVASIFDVKLDYYGSAASHLAKLDASGTVSDVNEKHLPPWAELCSAGKVANTPLTPYVDECILKGSHLHLDGAKLRKMDFVYQVPAPSRENIIKILEELIQQKMFPSNALPKGVLQC